MKERQDTDMKFFLMIAIVALTLFTGCSAITTNNSVTQAPTDDVSSTNGNNNSSSEAHLFFRGILVF